MRSRFRNRARYRIVLTSDAPEFGGYGRIDPAVKAFSFSQTDSDGSTRPYIRIYNLCRVGPRADQNESLNESN